MGPNSRLSSVAAWLPEDLLGGRATLAPATRAALASARLEQQLLHMAQGSAVGVVRASGPGAVGPEVPGGGVVGGARLQQAGQLEAVGRVRVLEQRLDPAGQVGVHPVRAAE